LDHALQTSVHRLDETGPVERNTVRDLLHPAVDNPIHHTNVLGKSSARGFVTCRYADLFINGALGIQFMAAIEAFQTGNMVKRNYAVAR
jgi:hypothetical protein